MKRIIFLFLLTNLTAMAQPTGGMLTVNGSGVVSGPVSGATFVSGNSLLTTSGTTTGSAASLTISGQTGLLTFAGLTSTNRILTIRDAADTVLELGGSYTPTGTWTSLTLVTPVLGTPTSGTLTNCTGIPVSTGVSGLGTGVATAAANNVNASGGLLTTAYSGFVATHAAGTPGIALGSGANGTGSSSSIAGSDVSGVITVTAGASATANATVCTVTFNTAYGTAPNNVTITPWNSNAALLSGATMVRGSGVSTTVFTITSGTSTLTPTVQYQWAYLVPQH